MGTPSWATYFDGVEPDYPGRPRDDKLYGYCPQQTSDTRKRKQGMVFPGNEFKLQDLEYISTTTGRNSVSSSWRSTSGSLPPCSPQMSPTYTSSSNFSDIQHLPPASTNQGRALPPNQGRALPPIPVDGSVHSGSVRSCSSRSQPKSPLELKLSQNNYNRELPLIPVEHRQNIHNDSKSKRKRPHREKSSRRSRKHASDHEPETAVVLTVSIRNGKHSKRLKHSEMLNNNIEDGLTSTFTVKKPLESTLSRERAAKEADKITVPLRSRMRRSRKRCLIPMVIITVLILAGLFSAVTFVLLRPQQNESSSTSSEQKDGLAMILAITHMRVINKKYVSEMSNSSSLEFLQFTGAFRDDINNVFLRSNTSSYFYGTSVSALRKGSIYTYSDLSFQDVEPLRDPSVFENILRYSSSPITYNNIKAVRIGDNIVDYDSIHVDLSFITVDTFPDKPKLKEVMQIVEEKPKVLNPLNSKTTEKPQNSHTTHSPVSVHGTTGAPSVVQNGDSNVHSEKPETATRSNDVTRADEPEKETVAPRSVIKTTTSVSRLTTVTESSNNPKGSTTISPETTLLTTKTAKTTGMAIGYENSIRSSGDNVNNLPEVALSTENTVTTPFVKVKTEINDTDGAALQNTTVICNFGNMDEWKFLIIQNTPYEGRPYLVMNLTSDERVTIPKEIKERLYLNLDVNSASGTIRVSFLLQCGDLGRYECKVHKGEYSYMGSGELKLLPIKPEVTLPVEIIDDKALQEPLLCRINVGYPPEESEFGWSFWSKGSGSFETIGNPDNSPIQSGVCGQIKTIRLILTKPVGLHMVQLKCAVKVKSVTKPTKVMEDIATIKVVPNTVCDGIPYDTYIKHPYTCNKYILCRNKDIQVKQCADNLCFDPSTKRCGQTGLEMSSVDAYLNEGVTLLTCRLLHIGSWSSISIYKYASDVKTRILTVRHGSSNVTVEPEVSHRLRATVDKPSKYEVVITLWVYSLGCQDEGTFSCAANVPFAVPEAYGRLNIKTKPDVPTVRIPIEIIDGREPREWFRCEGNVGYPKGRLYWQIRMKGDTDFTDKIPFKAKRDSENTTNCKTYVASEFRFTPSALHDGMEVRCVVENQDTMPGGQRLYTTKEIHVIPANFCADVSRDKRAHPNNCYQYIQCHDGYTYVQRCSIGLCFNPETQDCDIREEGKVDATIDPDFPCKPKRNGVYFPHKSICNKYIWCVQGQEVIQHCPLGTQYFKDGQCTFEENKFHCSRNSTVVV